jgi:hypothetical protein
LRSAQLVLTDEARAPDALRRLLLLDGGDAPVLRALRVVASPASTVAERQAAGDALRAQRLPGVCLEILLFCVEKKSSLPHHHGFGEHGGGAAGGVSPVHVWHA